MMIKKCYQKTLLVFILLFSMAVYAADQQKANPQAQWVLTKFIAIEKQVKNLHKKSFPLGNFYSEESGLDVYSSHGILKKAVITYYDEGSKVIDHYYFNNGLLILCRSINEEYPMDENGTVSSKKQVSKQYYLFKRGELISPQLAGAERMKYLNQGRTKRNSLMEAMGLSLVMEHN